MKMLFNGRELDNFVTHGATLGSALAAVQEQKVGPDNVISQIWVDGEMLTAERLSDWKTRPANEFNETRVEVQSRKHLISMGLKTIRQGLIESSDLRNTTVTALQQGQIDQAMRSLADYLNLWNTTQQSIASACRIMDCELETLHLTEPDQSLNISEQISNLTARLQDVKNALENGDFVLLADILNYEFGDLTSTWEMLIDIIAQTLDDR